MWPRSSGAREGHHDRRTVLVLREARARSLRPVRVAPSLSDGDLWARRVSVRAAGSLPLGTECGRGQLPRPR